MMERIYAKAKDNVGDYNKGCEPETVARYVSGAGFGGQHTFVHSTKVILTKVLFRLPAAADTVGALLIDSNGRTNRVHGIDIRRYTGLLRRNVLIS